MNDTNVNDTSSNSKSLHNIIKKYENLTYLDQYSSSVLLLFIISILLFMGISYCIVIINSKAIQQNWSADRCKPYIMPFAGIVNKPEGISAGDFTKQNFEYCMQNIVQGVTSDAISPLTYVVSVLSSISNTIEDGINSAREMINKVRTELIDIMQEVMGRIENVMIPLQKIILGAKDMFGKVQGIMTTVLFTLLGAYYTLQSLLGAIGQIIVTILVVMALAIAMMWIVPFTWGAAAAMTAIFIALSVPFALILIFLKDTMKIGGGLKIPSIKCFDEDTIILLADGREKKIKEIEVNDKLHDGSEVTTKIKVTSYGSDMYNLNNVIVSDSHVVNYKDKWMRVSDHPESKKIDCYSKPYLYCLNTSSKIICINNCIFTDWDEIYDKKLHFVKSYLQNIYPEIKIKNTDIHKFLNSGFLEDTSIILKNGKEKEIKNIEIGDVLMNGEKVYGVVELDGTNLYKQYICSLGNIHIHCSQNLYVLNKYINNKPYFLIYSKCMERTKNADKLYNLLTDKNMFQVEDTIFGDYNVSIDFILEIMPDKITTSKAITSKAITSKMNENVASSIEDLVDLNMFILEYNV